MIKDVVKPSNQAATKVRSLPSVAAATLLAFGTFGCSAADDGRDEEPLAASEVCDSSLDATAAAALKRVGETKEFTELPGNNDDGQPNRFSLKRSATTLHRTFAQNKCVIFKADDDSGHPLISIAFSARESSPEQYKGESDDTFYPMGTYTKTSNDRYALLYFKCATKDPEGKKGSMSYIRAVLSSVGRTSASSTGHDLMTILNSVSRAMAKTLGCESEAALPSKVPPARAH